MSLLELADVEKHFGAVQALRGVSFAVEPGEVVGLVGDNGAGKSTLMKTITGIHAPDGGEVRFDGAVLNGKHPGEIRGLGIRELPYEPAAVIRLVVDLAAAAERMPPAAATETEIEGVRLPRLAVAPGENPFSLVVASLTWGAA